MKPLFQIKVLITRPAQQGQILGEKIATLGGRFILLPTIEIAEASDQKLLQAQIQQLDKQDIAIFISPNAVQKTAPLIQQWPLKVKVGAVGSSTAETLHACHLPVDFYPTEKLSSEGLLALPALQQVSGKKIMLFQGEGGRELLATTLRQRGAEVTEVIAYRRILPAIAKLPSEEVDIVICTSQTSLENLLTLVGERLLNKPLLVSSQRLAEIASILGFIKPPLIADNATDEALIKALMTWWEKENGTTKKTT